MKRKIRESKQIGLKKVTIAKLDKSSLISIKGGDPVNPITGVGGGAGTSGASMTC